MAETPSVVDSTSCLSIEKEGSTFVEEISQEGSTSNNQKFLLEPDPLNIIKETNTMQCESNKDGLAIAIKNNNVEISSDSTILPNSSMEQITNSDVFSQETIGEIQESFITQDNTDSLNMNPNLVAHLVPENIILQEKEVSSDIHISHQENSYSGVQESLSISSVEGPSDFSSKNSTEETLINSFPDKPPDSQSAENLFENNAFSMTRTLYTCDKDLSANNSKIGTENSNHRTFLSSETKELPKDLTSENLITICATTENIEDNKAVINALCSHQFDKETSNAAFTEISALKEQLHFEKTAFKKAELQIREEFLSNMEKLSKDCNMLRKEKEAMVIKYANSEKEVIKERKRNSEIEKRLKDLHKDRENLLLKVKNLNSDNSRLASSCESKLLEIARLQKNADRLNEDFNSRDVKIKWLQNKLKNEMNSHQETQGKYEQTLNRLNEMKEEAEQVRRDCQEMIKCYQEAEEIKSVKLDGQLKQKLTELEVQKQEKSDQEQVYHLLRQELEAIKKRQRLTMEENNSLTLKINILEKNRLEYEQNLSKQKETQNNLKQEVVDLTARLAEMETLRLQLEREKEKSFASLREVERLRLTNAEMQADMNACHMKEGELLKFTEGVTDTNVKLQSAYSLLEVKSQSLEDELNKLRGQYTEVEQKYLQSVRERETAQKLYDDEVHALARKLAEKTKNVEKLNIKLDEAENENRVLKRRHITSIKELSRELTDCKKRLDLYDSSNCIQGEWTSLESRSSSTASLDAVNSNDARSNDLLPSPRSVGGGEEKTSPATKSSQNLTDIPGVDQELLIERIIKLQKTVARKNDKIDFLEDHIVQLIKEMNSMSRK